jgi:hypothetical protein
MSPEHMYPMLEYTTILWFAVDSVESGVRFRGTSFHNQMLITAVRQ